MDGSYQSDAILIGDPFIVKLENYHDFIKVTFIQQVDFDWQRIKKK